MAHRDATQAQRVIGVELEAQPEYKKMRVLAQEIARRR